MWVAVVLPWFIGPCLEAVAPRHPRTSRHGGQGAPPRQCRVLDGLFVLARMPRWRSLHHPRGRKSVSACWSLHADHMSCMREAPRPPPPQASKSQGARRAGRQILRGRPALARSLLGPWRCELWPIDVHACITACRLHALLNFWRSTCTHASRLRTPCHVNAVFRSTCSHHVGHGEHWHGWITRVRMQSQCRASAPPQQAQPLRPQPGGSMDAGGSDQGRL